ncbi:Rv1355c family protein [Parapedobacter sp. DT-150]|uniref:Rv1355c family protein n=1 Tax=Parapedobacter sp. DT-150 TaxID=3396162 RepID=UPI003F19A7CC
MTTGYLQHGILAQTLADQQKDGDVIRPSFFRLSSNADGTALHELLQKKPYIRIFDTIDQQLTELVKSFFPKRTLGKDDITSLIATHLGETPKIAYGVWVYYPWNETLVHILDEDEFIRMRTSRNRYKITEEEQAHLMTKRIGVIGLSVGQSVSLTLCMERGFGELRIADFDELEITNLNRLRSGLHNMGLKKTVIVAREIAEIDPFLKVTCYHEGITTVNLENFLLHGGKLDLLIEECDGVDVKINSRVAAKKHRIPVLMEASDRGTVDVERFDLEPERPILHGFVEHLDLSNVGQAKTMEEKLPYILPIVGVETMSTRLKASAIEIGQTISTWPQLASAVTMGGGITADVCRRVLLNQFHQSGRYFIDLDELIGDPKSPNPSFVYEKKSLTDRDIIKIVGKTHTVAEGVEDAMDVAVITELVDAARKAPSPGNNQPWKWCFDGRWLHLFHDIERSESFGDFEHMASYMTFGTAIENLRLKARELGFEIIERYFPTQDQQLHIAAFGFRKAKLAKDDLVDFIGIRFTNRHLGSGQPIGREQLAALHDAARNVHGVDLKIVDDKAKIARLAAIAGQSEKLRLFIPQGHYELFEKELRWSIEEVEASKDGLDLRLLELSPKDNIGFRVSRDPAAMRLVAEWGKGKALENMTANLVSTSAAVGLITADSLDPSDCLLVGSAMQRLWLTANQYDISVQPILAPILHFARVNHGGGHTMDSSIENEFRQLNREFNELVELDGNKKEPMFLFRMFYAKQPTAKATRMALENVFLNLAKRG